MSHNSPGGALGSQFRIPTPECWTGATFLSSVPAAGFDMVGNTEDDVIVSYGQCFTGSFLIATISYYSMGLAPPCCLVRVFDSPTSPQDGIVILNCGQEQHVVSSHSLLVNPQGPCNCTTPARDTTWGQIKALYTDR